MDLLPLIQKLGLPLGLAVILLVLGHRRVWCFGYQLTDCEKRNAEQKADYEARLSASQRREDEWKELVLTDTRRLSEELRESRKRTSERG